MKATIIFYLSLISLIAGQDWKRIGLKPDPPKNPTKIFDPHGRVLLARIHRNVWLDVNTDYMYYYLQTKHYFLEFSIKWDGHTLNAPKKTLTYDTKQKELKWEDVIGVDDKREYDEIDNEKAYYALEKKHKKLKAARRPNPYDVKVVLNKPSEEKIPTEILPIKGNYWKPTIIAKKRYGPLLEGTKASQQVLCHPRDWKRISCGWAILYDSGDGKWETPLITDTKFTHVEANKFRDDRRDISVIFDVESKAKTKSLRLSIRYEQHQEIEIFYYVQCKAQCALHASNGVLQHGDPFTAAYFVKLGDELNYEKKCDTCESKLGYLTTKHQDPKNPAELNKCGIPTGYWHYCVIDKAFTEHGFSVKWMTKHIAMQEAKKETGKKNHWKAKLKDFKSDHVKPNKIGIIFEMGVGAGAAHYWSIKYMNNLNSWVQFDSTNGGPFLITESEIESTILSKEMQGIAVISKKTGIPHYYGASSEFDDIYDEVYYDNMYISDVKPVGYWKEIINNNNNDINSIKWIIFAASMILLMFGILCALCCCVFGIIGAVSGYCGKWFMYKKLKTRNDNELI